VTSGECTLTLLLHSASAGEMLADNLSIEGCVYQPQQVRCSSCSQCGGGDDCKDFGPWSQPSCVWPDTCSQSANCTSTRSVTTYTCNNPGSVSSTCSAIQSSEEQGTIQTRNTTGQSCDDGLLCTVNDTCSGGVCSGQPKVCNDQNPCTDDSCNQLTGQCSFVNNDANACGAFRECPQNHCIGLNWTTFPQSGHDFCSAGVCQAYSCSAISSQFNQSCQLEIDSDQDGVPDSQDACPLVPGTACNGCPNPCTGCGQMVCEEDSAPTCVADDSQCSATTCPAAGCGLGG
jgi:hypothetical protein